MAQWTNPTRFITHNGATIASNQSRYLDSSYDADRNGSTSDVTETTHIDNLYIYEPPDNQNYIESDFQSVQNLNPLAIIQNDINCPWFRTQYGIGIRPFRFKNLDRNPFGMREDDVSSAKIYLNLENLPQSLTRTYTFSVDTTPHDGDIHGQTIDMSGYGQSGKYWHQARIEEGVNQTTKTSDASFSIGLFGVRRDPDNGEQYVAGLISGADTEGTVELAGEVPTWQTVYCTNMIKGYLKHCKKDYIGFYLALMPEGAAALTQEDSWNDLETLQNIRSATLDWTLTLNHSYNSEPMFWTGSATTRQLKWTDPTIGHISIKYDAGVAFSDSEMLDYAEAPNQA